MEQNKRTIEDDSDHKFNRLFLSSVLAMLICIFALCSTSYAWFSASISSEKNSLKSACFSLDVTVIDLQSDISLTTDGSLYRLAEGKRYCITLKKSEETTASQGHCAVLIGQSAFCTEIFQADFSFFIYAIAETTVAFDARIGYSAEPDLIENGETLSLPT